MSVNGIGGGTRPANLGLDIRSEGLSPLDKAKGSSFEDTFTQLLNQASASQDSAQDLQQRFMRGENVELHQVMAATEEAGLSLDLLVELRNKVSEAYRSLVNIQG